MPIERSIEDLPRHRAEGTPPARDNFVARLLADAWMKEYLRRGDDHRALAIPDAGPYRASYANTRCNRQLWYQMNGIGRSAELRVHDAWRFGLGQMVHHDLEPVVLEAFKGSAEGDVDLRPLGIPGSGHYDLVSAIPDAEGVSHNYLIELKTINGFAFKTRATHFKSPPKGPSFGHVLQAALLAHAINRIEDHPKIERVIIAYLALENISEQLATYADNDAARFSAEWHYTVDELAPMVATETARIKQLAFAISENFLPTRELVDPEYPKGATVQRPLTKDAPWAVTTSDGITDYGSTWMCGYCDWRQRCLDDGEGGHVIETPVTVTP